MSNFVAVYDACVLYPAPIRDLLLHLACSGLFRARWTDRIHDEWTSAILRKRNDLHAAQLQRTRELMNSAVRDCLVFGYEPLEAGLQLPDPDDRHVLAAAIHCHAGVIVTYNVKDFPDEVLAPLGISAQHPDEFIGHAFDLNPAVVCKAVHDQCIVEEPTEKHRGIVRYLPETRAGHDRFTAARARRSAVISAVVSGLAPLIDPTRRPALAHSRRHFSH